MSSHRYEVMSLYDVIHSILFESLAIRGALTVNMDTFIELNFKSHILK